MSGKHYKKLGKTKLIRVPEKTVDWVKKIVRKLDDKQNPEEIMGFINCILDNYPD